MFVQGSLVHYSVLTCNILHCTAVRAEQCNSAQCSTMQATVRLQVCPTAPFLIIPPSSREATDPTAYTEN